MAPTCRVLNKNTDIIPAGSVYIGRPSKWANPFVIGKHGTRAEVVEEYGEWFMTQKHLISSLHELEGKDLVCHCAPEACHGDFLLWMANPMMELEKLENEQG